MVVMATCTSNKLVVALFTFLCAPLGCKRSHLLRLPRPALPISHSLHLPRPRHALPLWKTLRTLTPCNPQTYAPQVLEPYHCLRASCGGPVFSEEEEVQGELGELQGPRYLETWEYEIAE